MRLRLFPANFVIMALCVSVVLAVSGCSSNGTDDAGDDSEDAESADSTTSTEPPNRAPDLRVPETVRVDVGQQWSDAIIAIDPDGDAVEVSVENRPQGFFTTANATGLINGFEWTPDDAGQWTVEVVAVDSEGRRTTTEIELIARYPRPDDLLLAMGDSVATGFGRDRSDYLGPDGCFRSEGSAYPGLVFDQLVAAGSLSETASFRMVACSGSTAADLIDRTVRATDRDGDLVADEWTQLDWAVRQNPTIVTLTVGGNDLLFTDPNDLLVDDADDDPALAIDEAAVGARLDEVGESLDTVLTTVLERTDAHVALTTYYAPTAILPVGVDGCGAVCFRIASLEIVERLNETIWAVAERQDEGRVTVVDLAPLFEGHEATNGFGPDIIREANFGPFQDLVSRFTRDTFPYCSDGDGTSDTFLTRLDCAHPNDDGHRAIAAAVTDELSRL